MTGANGALWCSMRPTTGTTCGAMKWAQYEVAMIERSTKTLCDASIAPNGCGPLKLGWSAGATAACSAVPGA